MYPVINTVAINSAESTEDAPIDRVADAHGHIALALGELTAKTGEDVDALVPSIKLVRSDWHSAEAVQTSGHVNAVAASAIALRLGAPTVLPGEVEAHAGGHVAIEVSAPAIGAVSFALSGRVLALGSPSAGAIASVRGRGCLGLGSPSASSELIFPSIALARTGRARIDVGGVFGDAASSSPLRLGGVGVSSAAYARQTLCMRLGPLTIDRGGSC